MIPRSFQRELYEKALNENVIAFLPTGSGKTFISIMLINEYLRREKNKINFKEDEENNLKYKRVIFLAPTVPLVTQQTQSISIHSSCKVKAFVGSMGVDFWDYEKWRNEIKKKEILVMTPMIFYNLLKHGILNLNKEIGLLIFDECHHCQKNHPYNMILKEFYHQSNFEINSEAKIENNSENIEKVEAKHSTNEIGLERPKIFGMTASPIQISVTKCKKQQENEEEGDMGFCNTCGVNYLSLEQKNQHLKGKKHEKLVKIRELSELKGKTWQINSKKLVKTQETQKHKHKQTLEYKLGQLEKRMNAKIYLPKAYEEIEKVISIPNEKNFFYDLISDKRKEKYFEMVTMTLNYLPSKIIEQIKYIVSEMGILPSFYCTDLLIKEVQSQKLLKRFESAKEKLDFERTANFYLENYFKFKQEIFTKIKDILKRANEIEKEENRVNYLLNKLFTPKIILLIKLLNSMKSDLIGDFCSIIFVQRRKAAKILKRIFTTHSISFANEELVLSLPDLFFSGLLLF